MSTTPEENEVKDWSWKDFGPRALVDQSYIEQECETVADGSQPDGVE